MRNLDIATLRSLQAVAEYGAVTRAAEALNMTQSALSMQIKRLEEVFARPLLEKQGRGIVLSEFAQLLLTESRKLVAQNDAIIARFTGVTPDCRLRVGLTTDWPPLHLTQAVRRFREAHPNVEIVLNDGASVALLKQFEQGELDVILTTEADCGMDGTVLMTIPLVWVGAVDGTAWRQRPLMLTNALWCAFLHMGTAALNRAGIAWQHASGVGSCERNLMMTAADQGVNILLRTHTREGLQRIDHGGALPPLPSASLNMYLTKGKVAAMAGEFGGYLRRAVQDEARVAA
ncbi:LysR family transcriptional regulator [Paracoccus sp. TK19116]|uniref:LysR family transcriptional regulator n=1 Tax=Paracoccus albicereus TaxID=2922394 RepID=A0ABT1MYE8_9RHOB|nr:LysR family transcriptional regulator [Paracoccus albicereus]MCQ0971896.1 LysR family transcriptional regulator [Paracoccus albicereus]